jgi:Zn-dependent peptidase ImmA (M78 family)
MITDIIISIRDKYNIRDIESVASAENINLLSIDLPKSIKGMYYSQEGFDVIALNKMLSGFEIIETFWHEYYHYLISVGNFISAKFCLDSIKNFSNKDESKAEEFVALLLVENIDEEDDLHSVTEKWNVTEELARLRFTLRPFDKAQGKQGSATTLRPFDRTQSKQSLMADK